MNLKPLSGAWWLGALLGLGAAGPEDPIAVEIHEDKVLHVLPSDYDGTNLAAFWNPTRTGHGAGKAVGQMGVRLLRYPGGVPCQFMDWEKGVPAHYRDVVPTDELYSFAKATGVSLILQTNTANDSTDEKSGKSFAFDSSGEHQAGWVKLAREKGIKVAFWEIGNEPEMDAPKEHKGSQEKVFAWYNAKYEEQVRAIRKVDPKARVLGPASTNVWFWHHEQNLKKFLVAHGNKTGTGLADALSLHYYPSGAGDWAQTRSLPQKDWAKCWDYVSGVIKENDTRALPVYITEWNFAGGMKDDSAAWLATALGNADLVGMFRRTGVAGHAHFCLQRIGHGWGFLALRGDLKPEGEASPTYFSLLMAARLGNRVLDTKTGADEANVLSAYATKRDDGSLQVMLINKSDQPQTVALSFSKLNPRGKPLEVYTLQGISGKVTDTDVIYNGIASPKPGSEDLPAPKTVSAPPKITRTLPPFSIELLVLGRPPK